MARTETMLSFTYTKMDRKSGEFNLVYGKVIEAEGDDVDFQDTTVRPMLHVECDQ